MSLFVDRLTNPSRQVVAADLTTYARTANSVVSGYPTLGYGTVNLQKDGEDFYCLGYVVDFSGNLIKGVCERIVSALISPPERSFDSRDCYSLSIINELPIA